MYVLTPKARKLMEEANANIAAITGLTVSLEDEDVKRIVDLGIAIGMFTIINDWVVCEGDPIALILSKSE